MRNEYVIGAGLRTKRKLRRALARDGALKQYNAWSLGEADRGSRHPVQHDRSPSCGDLSHAERWAT